MPQWTRTAWRSKSGDAYWDFADYIHANKHEVARKKTPGTFLQPSTR
jgi:hypothetical protein